MIPLDQYQQLVRNRDKFRRQRDQAQGAYDQVLARLEVETGCSTLEEAEELLAKLKKKEEFKLPAYQKAEKEFWDKWGEQIEKVVSK